MKLPGFYKKQKIHAQTVIANITCLKALWYDIKVFPKGQN